MHLDPPFYLSTWWGVGDGQGMSRSRQGNVRSTCTKCSKQRPWPHCVCSARSCSRSELQRCVRALAGGSFKMVCWTGTGRKGQKIGLLLMNCVFTVQWCSLCMWIQADEKTNLLLQQKEWRLSPCKIHGIWIWGLSYTGTGVGLDDFCASLPTQDGLWFYDSVTAPGNRSS